ncbi:MAG: hypothetical protein WA754_10150 [Pseudolabrys sp.]
MGEVVGQRPWLMEAPGLVEPAASTAVSSAAVAFLGPHRGALLPGEEKMQRVSRRGAWREGTSEADDFGVSEFRPPPLSYLNLSAAFITMKAGLAIRS